MLIPLLLGCLTIFISMGIQLVAVVLMLKYLSGIVSDIRRRSFSLSFNAYVLGIVLLMLFTGNMIQISVWAMLFFHLGEFGDFSTAFYHSAVNFGSLGYGDIVMSEKWRLLGALEASNGVLMFGLTAGTLLAVMTRLIKAESQTVGQFTQKKRH